MATFILVNGGNMSMDMWNRLTGKNDYPARGSRARGTGSGPFRSLRCMAIKRLLRRWQMDPTIPGLINSGESTGMSFFVSCAIAARVRADFVESGQYKT
jgi:hypothetical protein